MLRKLRESEAEWFGPNCKNLAKLIVGAEGTLATIVGATVHLAPLPQARGVLVLEFNSLESAVAAVNPVLEFAPSAAELFDGMLIHMAQQSLEYRNYLDFVSGDPESLLLVEFSGDSEEELREKMEATTAALAGHAGLTHTLPALEPKLRDHIWACRKAALPLLQGVPGSRRPVAFVEDSAVPPQRLPEFVDRFKQMMHSEGTDGSFYGHASVGCLHIRPMLDLTRHDDRLRMKRILETVSDLVLEFGGSMSGEHGDGLARSFLNEKLFGSQLYQAFQQIKRAFDPNGLLNPGKIVNAPPPDENLRHGEGYKTRDVETVLDFSAQGGLAGAAAMCNGAGVCRKTHTGTMCPSFMATGDEEHSTRGRANALRMVLSGALPPEELTGQRLYDTYDLCLACKGCKAECPTNVDVAKMKAEFLHLYYQQNEVPRSVRWLADVARLNALGSKFAPVSNWLASAPGASRLAETLARRRPPAFVAAFSADSFPQMVRPATKA